MKNILFLLGLFVFLSSCALQKSIKHLDKIEDLEYPFQTHNIELDNGISIAYIDEGQGEQTILFIHGLGSYIPAWTKNVEALKSNYRCIAIDLPGYGKSSKGKFAGDLRTNAKIVLEVIEKLDLKNVTLAGHSMGGQIAMITALAAPKQVNKLILVSPAGFETFTKGQKQWFRDVMTTDLVKYTSVEAIKSNLAYNFYDMPDDAAFMIKDRIEMRTASDFDWYCYMIPLNVQGMVDDPVYDLLPQISQPTLVTFGANDNLIPNRFLNGGKTEKYAKAGAERIPNSELVMIPKAGHFAHFEKANVFNTAVINFLK